MVGGGGGGGRGTNLWETTFCYMHAIPPFMGAYYPDTCSVSYIPCSHTASSLVYLSLVLVWSLLALLGQALFQIVLTTEYSNLLKPC